MSNYIVDDADLTSVANAIRTKGGTSAPLAFPAGFVSAIADIPSGGGVLTFDDQIAVLNELGTQTIPAVVTLAGTMLAKQIFGGNTTLKSISGQNVTSVIAAPKAGSSGALQDCFNLEEAVFPILNGGDLSGLFSGCSKLVRVVLTNVSSSGSNMFMNCTGLIAISLPNAATVYSNSFSGCSALEVVDFGVRTQLMRATIFNGCSQLETLVLRGSNELTSLSYTNVFQGTPFASGGTGGTIYIPKVLYDHLGDGTSLDYKAATNWSTIDGYGTITWAKIEGSIYETQYADGTPIPT